jgi:hypothetical protein
MARVRAKSSIGVEVGALAALRKADRRIQSVKQM